MSALPLSTTAEFPGAEITGHLGLVTVNIVAGTGFGADFAAGFTDIFGGRSDAYQAQLGAIGEEVQAELWRKARRLGASAVVGVRVDYDEISGKGKQMLMVSAAGTAVTTRSLSGAVRADVPTDAVRSEDVRRESVIETLLAGLPTGDYGYATLDEVWAKLAEYPSPRLFPVVLDLVVRQSPKPDAWNHDAVVKSGAVRRGIEFLSALPREEAKAVVVGELSQAFPPAHPFHAHAVSALRLADYDAALGLVASDDEWARKGALAVAHAAQPSYDAADAAVMRRLAAVLPTSFPDIAERGEKRGVFSKGETVACPLCPGTITMGRCEVCGSDERGLFAWEPDPARVAYSLNDKARLVEALLAP